MKTKSKNEKRSIFNRNGLTFKSLKTPLPIKRLKKNNVAIESKYIFVIFGINNGLDSQPTIEFHLGIIMTDKNRNNPK